MNNIKRQLYQEIIFIDNKGIVSNILWEWSSRLGEKQLPTTINLMRHFAFIRLRRRNDFIYNNKHCLLQPRLTSSYIRYIEAQSTNCVCVSTKQWFCCTLILSISLAIKRNRLSFQCWFNCQSFKVHSKDFWKEWI